MYLQGGHVSCPRHVDKLSTKVKLLHLSLEHGKNKKKPWPKPLNCMHHVSLKSWKNVKYKLFMPGKNLCVMEKKNRK